MKANCCCLCREEYKSLLYKILYNRDIEDELTDFITHIIDRAGQDWDINIIGVNYFLTIILEQLLKREDIQVELIKEIYELQDKMFFTIEEMNYNFIEELFQNHLPNKRNHCQTSLIQAKKDNNDALVQTLESKRDASFEEDLLDVIKVYYE